MIMKKNTTNYIKRIASFTLVLIILGVTLLTAGGITAAVAINMNNSPKEPVAVVEEEDNKQELISEDNTVEETGDETPHPRSAR